MFLSWAWGLDTQAQFLFHSLQAELLLLGTFMIAFKASTHIVQGSLLIWSQLVEDVNPIFKRLLQRCLDLGFTKQLVNIV